MEEVSFQKVYFLFQSDGLNSYLNSCVFITNANSLDDAIEKEKYISDIVLSKYDLLEVNPSDENPSHCGGISPLWDGRWNTLDLAEYGPAVCTDIIKYDSELVDVFGIPYAVRIMYGPYYYVKEEF